MLSVVVPAYNEEQRLPETLRQLTTYGPVGEIIVVDDGSTDKTFELATKYGATVLRNSVNYGKGYSVRRGALAAKGDVVLFTDADMATPIKDAAMLMKAIRDGSDIAIGSRYMPGSIIHDWSPARRLASKMFALFVRAATGLRYKDTQCGFKMFTKDAAQEIFSRSYEYRFAFDVEVLLLAKSMGFDVAEVPVEWSDAPGSTVKMWGDGSRMLGSVVGLVRRDPAQRFFKKVL
ncbi:MAG: glycosyltransferase family 2 protein [Dehalococcoidia bacterium]|nr:MAG: glycosyltransferase family 2 protein [Dehalococcoidia bacterium]